MIARVWHGWASVEKADAYQRHFETSVMSHLRLVAGFRAAQLWRRQVAGEIEFAAVTTWDSLDAIRAFAGAEYERAVVEAEARRVLTRFNERVSHYDVVGLVGESE